jgi:transposase
VIASYYHAPTEDEGSDPMRGSDEQPGYLFSYVSAEARVPADHPLRPVRQIVDEALRRLSPRFERLYVRWGRPSIAPEKLLRALLLQVLYTIRSERQLVEQLQYNLLFQWFVGLSLDDAVWDATTFTKNRDRLLVGEIADAFFQEVLAAARTQGLLSTEHFTVDGTLLEAWASQKSFRPRDDRGGDDDGDRGNPTVNFRGTARRNDTHQSTTDPDARLARKGVGREAKLSYAAHALIENRHGLIVETALTAADGYAEVEGALTMLGELPQGWRITVGADKAYDTPRFVEGCRLMGITPHVAQKSSYSAIDRRTTRTAGYAVSQQRRKQIEEAFGWMKTIGLLRKLRHRGGPLVAWIFTFTAAAYNLVRMRTLMAIPA